MRTSKISIEKAIVTKEISTIRSEDIIQYDVVNKYGGINKIPRNSYLARRISDSHDQIASESDVVLLWPFFSSHLSLPLKVGEVVWAIFDREMIDQGWWMTRIHSDEDGEDLSFSVYDRRYVKTSTPTGIVSRLSYDANSISSAKKSFQNYNLRYDTKYNQFENIINLSNSIQLNEPVPKFTKRSGDFVIQGSNNALVCLGTDRYWTKEEQPELSGSNALNKQIEPFSGMIDLVTGRARSISINPDAPKRTASKIYKHEDRDWSEIEKGAAASYLEGDPDFYYDAARIYIAMKTQVDEALSLRDYTPILPQDAAIRPFSSGSAILSKADHIRIVARKDEDLGINGTIKIVKEGFFNKEIAGDRVLDGCSISLLDDGIIHVAGQKIFLGLSATDTQIEQFQVSGEENTGLAQPYIKFQDLKQLLINLISQIEKFRSEFKSHINNFNSHTHTGTCAVGPVQTNPTTSRSTTNVQDFIVENKTTNENDYNKLIENIKSLRIFGE